MITLLKTEGIGPADKMKLDFGRRINILTGDNGLGKSFILDIVWWALTKRWPAEVNRNLTSGNKALPNPHVQGTIEYSFSTERGKKQNYKSQFRRDQQAWTIQQGRPPIPGLVLYAMSDGSFAIWDPHRNYWKNTSTNLFSEIVERPPAYVFSSAEVWDGLGDKENQWLCNGLIRDWASWQKENGESFEYLKNLLKLLSPSSDERLEPGKLTRISLDDARDIPTIKMPYGEIPVVHASAGMRRIIALAYLLVWTWEEHKHAANLLEKPFTSQITFLIDEIESHLHPSWQRIIVPTLLQVMSALAANKADIQLITATHSPLIMASLETLFDQEKDAWFDLDLVDNKVELQKRSYERRGDASNWLTSHAFDLPSAGSKEAEKVMQKVQQFMKHNPDDKKQAQILHQELKNVLSEIDPFWISWNYMGEKKGWFK